MNWEQLSVFLVGQAILLTTHHFYRYLRHRDAFSEMEKQTALLEEIRNLLKPQG